MTDTNTRIMIGDTNNVVEVRSSDEGIETIMIWSNSHGLSLYHIDAIAAFMEYKEKRSNDN